MPLWMSIDTKIGDKGQRVTGLFAVKNRVFSKIIQKQIEVVNNLDYHLENNVAIVTSLELLRDSCERRYQESAEDDAGPEP